MALLTGCADAPRSGPSPPEQRASILLVTLDTVRADALEPEAAAGSTPAFARLAERGLRFEQAYATAPMTLPSHASMLTGLLPPGHGVHENARPLDGAVPTVAERLAAAGWSTTAFVSGYPLARQFGLARGFAHYDDELPVRGLERSAGETVDLAVAHLAAGREPTLVWVHLYDAHDPYEPPEPYRSRFPDDPYRGEVAYVDAQLGRLLEAFEARAPGGRIVVVADHGEGLGEQGERHHGNLASQGVMRVPLVLAGEGVPRGVRSEPVSTRRVFDTVLGWAGIESAGASLESELAQPVLGEAMQPHLAYGWAPQVMAVGGRFKLLRTTRNHVYDVLADPGEETDLGDRVEIDRGLLRAVREYPLPRVEEGVELDDEQRRALASLGYVSSAAGGSGSRSGDLPEPRAMAHLFPDLERGSALFAAGSYAEVVPVFERILAVDPENPMATVQLAVAESRLGRVERADAAFARAARLAGDSLDTQLYHALHLLRSGRTALAAPLLEAVVARAPRRQPALEGLALVREEQGRVGEAAELHQRVAELASRPGAAWARVGELAMELGQTERAIDAFERAREAEGDGFRHAFELGVCYLAARRPAEAAAMLDLVPADHPGYELALFKRAQASVLLGEAGAAQRIERVRGSRDPEVRELAARERLFERR